MSNLAVLLQSAGKHSTLSLHDNLCCALLIYWLPEASIGDMRLSNRLKSCRIMELA